MLNHSFDAGIFLTLAILGFVAMLMAKQRGSILLLVSVVSFTVIGLLIITGYDVSSFTQVSDSTGVTTNQTTYFIGNGSAPNGVGQLWMGWIFITLSIVTAAMFLNALAQGDKFL